MKVLVNVWIIVLIAWCTLVALVFLGLAAATSVESVKEQKRYTVHTPDAVYLDLSKETNNGTWAAYRTTTGKIIIVSGTFTEIEQ